MADVRDASIPSRCDFRRAFTAGRLLALRGRRFFFVDPVVGVPESSVIVVLRGFDLENIT